MTTSPAKIFNHSLLSARMKRNTTDILNNHFLYQDIQDNLLDRLNDINRQFTNILEIGYDGAAPLMQNSTKINFHNLKHEVIPFEENQFDLVISNLALHWINDLPGFLIQIKNILKPDGLLIASLFGGQTLDELRTSLNQAEMEIMNGLSPRISPMIDIKDAGALLQRAGFNLPVVDTETTKVLYDDMFDLLQDLRSMKQTNSLVEQNKKIVPKTLFPLANQHYQSRFSDEEGLIPAHFETLYLTGWKPHKSQQKPLKPGSAKNRLADALQTNEIKLDNE